MKTTEKNHRRRITDEAMRETHDDTENARPYYSSVPDTPPVRLRGTAGKAYEAFKKDYIASEEEKFHGVRMWTVSYQLEDLFRYMESVPEDMLVFLEEKMRLTGIEFERTMRPAHDRETVMMISRHAADACEDEDALLAKKTALEPAAVRTACVREHSGFVKTVSEVIFTNASCGLVFVSAIRVNDFTTVYVSKESNYDRLMYLSTSNADFYLTAKRMRRSSLRVITSMKDQVKVPIDSAFADEIGFVLRVNEFTRQQPDAKKTDEQWIREYRSRPIITKIRRYDA